MNDVRIIKDGDRTLAIFIRKGASVTDGKRFFGKPEDSLQVGIFERPAGYRAKPHRHAPLPSAMKMGEFIFVEEGSMKVTVFREDWTIVAEETVASGDCFLFLEGGHAVEMLTPTRFLEVKQGPYPGDQNAKIYQPSA